MNQKKHTAIMAGMLAAALLIGGAFMLGIGLFLLFCVFVWFR